MPEFPTKERVITPEEASLIKAIASKAKQLRMEQGLSYEAFAVKNDIHRITYYKFEKGNQNFNIITLLKVLKGLGMTLSEFFKSLD